MNNDDDNDDDGGNGDAGGQDDNDDDDDDDDDDYGDDEDETMMMMAMFMFFTAPCRHMHRRGFRGPGTPYPALWRAAGNAKIEHVRSTVHCKRTTGHPILFWEAVARETLKRPRETSTGNDLVADHTPQQPVTGARPCHCALAHGRAIIG